MVQVLEFRGGLKMCEKCDFFICKYMRRKILFIRNEILQKERAKNRGTKQEKMAIYSGGVMLIVCI